MGKFEQSKLGQAVLWVAWLVTLPLQIAAFLIIWFWLLVTGRNWND